MPLTEKERLEAAKLKENDKFEFNLAPKGIKKKDIQGEDFKFIHFGKERMPPRKKKQPAEVPANKRPDIEDEFAAIMHDDKKWKKRFENNAEKPKVFKPKRERFNKNPKAAYHRTDYERDAPATKISRSDDTQDQTPSFTMAQWFIDKKTKKKGIQ